MMHRTGKYKRLNLIFGLFPFIATVLISIMREDSSPVQLWLSIVSWRLGHCWEKRDPFAAESIDSSVFGSASAWVWQCCSSADNAQ